jgi:hypothetical protein
MALPLEALDKDQLAAKRELRSLNITLIKADTPAKVQQVKLIQQLNVALLTSTEDAQIITVATSLKGGDQVTSAGSLRAYKVDGEDEDTGGAGHGSG